MAEEEVVTFILSDGTETTSLTAVQEDIKKTLQAKLDQVEKINIDSPEAWKEFAELFATEE